MAARTYQVNRPLQNDVITMELWHTGRKICHQRAAEFFADNEDVYQWDCPDLDQPQIKWRVRVTENGRQLDVSAVAENGDIFKNYNTTFEKFEDWTEYSNLE